MTETYEDVRDNSDVVSSSLRETWIRADQKERALRDEYERIAAAENLHQEAKVRKAQEAYQRMREAIEKGRKQAREGLPRRHRREGGA